MLFGMEDGCIKDNVLFVLLFYNVKYVVKLGWLNLVLLFGYVGVWCVKIKDVY